MVVDEAVEGVNALALCRTGSPLPVGCSPPEAVIFLSSCT
jgi:hypothetical protein